MRLDAEKHGARWSTESDPRVIPILGTFLRKSHLDELPQLWNVLKGDMTLVGPRPERPEFHELLKDQVEGWEKRLQVKPGLTSLACIRNGYANNVGAARRKLKYDLFYIERKNFWLDLKIIYNTFLYIIGLEKRREFA